MYDGRDQEPQIKCDNKGTHHCKEGSSVLNEILTVEIMYIDGFFYPSRFTPQTW